MTGIHIKVILMFRRGGGADDKSLWIRETRGCVECRLEIADTEDRVSDAIRKDGVRGGRRFRMVSRQSKIACSSVVSVEAEFLCRKAIAIALSPVMYA